MKSMSKAISIQYQWNQENLNRLFEASYAYQFNHSKRRFIGWFFIALLQYGVVVAFKKEAFAILLFASIILFYWYYGKKWIAKKRAIKSFEESEFKDKEIKLTVDEEGFELIAPKKEHWNWDEIDEVVSLGDDIMIYKHPNFHYIPSSGFKSLEEKSQFKSIAKKHGRLR